MSKITKICNVCKKEFTTFNPDTMFCSRVCYYKFKENSILKLKCKYCGKEFKTSNSDIKRGRQYCSKKCFGLDNIKIDKTPKKCEYCKKEFVPNKVAANRVHLIKFCSKDCYLNHRKYNPINNKKQFIIANCKYCGNEFETTEFRLKYGKLYCSDICRNNDIKKNIIIKICEYCGKEFEGYNTGGKKYQKCCSIDCSNKSIAKEILETTCNQCGKSVIIKGKEHHRLKSKHGNFCSVECVHKYNSDNFSGKNSSAWKGGISFLPYCYKFNDKRKKAVRDFFNNTCIICGKHQSEEMSQLHVHHIYYNKDDGCDGSPFNLVSLCHSCHSATNHNREEWEIYITKLFDNLFDNGIFSREYYNKEVMYPES